MLCGAFLRLVVVLGVACVVGGTSSNRTECIAAYLARPEFRGITLLPGCPAFVAATRIDNVRAEVVPAAVVIPCTVLDVQLALEAARACHSPFSALSGGHSAAGYGLSVDGLVLALRPAVPGAPSACRPGGEAGFGLPHPEPPTVGGGFATVGPLNRQTGILRVGAGARFSEVYAAVNGTGWVPVGGGCPQVGVAGFILGGGWSFLSRSYGLACDKLTAAELVLANGTALRLEKSNAATMPQPQAELWWALCGGGGGNFGVATAFELQLVRPVEPMLVGELCWAPFSGAAHQLFALWLERWATMPRWLDVDPVWLPLGPNSSRLFCLTIACNESPGACASAVAPFRAVPNITLNTLKTQPFLTWQMANVNATDAQTGALYLKSGVLLPGALTLDIVDGLQAALQAAPSTRNLVLFHVGGGAIADLASNATAFPHRGAQLIIQVKAIWAGDEPSVSNANIAWVESVFATIAPVLSGAYVNYIDAQLRDWQTAYYDRNYARLQNVKANVDPDNVFRFHQSIELPTPFP